MAKVIKRVAKEGKPVHARTEQGHLELTFWNHGEAEIEIPSKMPNALGVRIDLINETNRGSAPEGAIYRLTFYKPIPPGYRGMKTAVTVPGKGAVYVSEKGFILPNGEKPFPDSEF